MTAELGLKIARGVMLHRFWRGFTAPFMAVVLAVTVPLGNSVSENRAPLTWWQACKDWVTG